MAEIEDFAHGTYADYSGVVFYGPATNGTWADRLAISDRYIGPLFRGILDRAWMQSGGEFVPKLASDWNTLQGWVAADGPAPVTTADARDFVEALTQLDASDVITHCAGCTVEQCLRCAAVIIDFFGKQPIREGGLFIEDD